MVVNRIHIIGAPGSGKTYVARQLAQQLNLKAIDLDKIGFVGGAGPARSQTDRLNEVAQIAEQQTGWITEGIYLEWSEKLFATADVIIWLDLPWRICCWRIIMRHIRASIAGTNQHKGVKKLLNFLRWTHSYHYSALSLTDGKVTDTNNNRAAAEFYLKAYTNKTIHCKNSNEVTKAVADLTRQVSN